MATPSEITPLIEQAWSLDPEEHFFEFMYDVLKSNQTLFSLGSLTHDEFKASLEAYIAAGGNVDEETVQPDAGTDEGSP